MRSLTVIALVSLGLGLGLGAVGCSGGGSADGTGDTGPNTVRANADAFTAQPFFPTTFNVGANDEGEELKVVDLTEPSEGSEVERRGARSVVYEANPEFTGIETFEYTIRDGLGDEDSATVEVEVIAPPTVTITSPADGATLTDATATIEFEVDGCTVSLPSQNADGCHLHTKIDGSAYSGGEGGQGHYTADPRMLEELPSGEIAITFRLVTNDGSDREFRMPNLDYLEDTITVTVPEPAMP